MRTLTIDGGGSLIYEWELTLDEWHALHEGLFDVLGCPTAQHRDGSAVDLAERVAVRMGSVGEPRREITVEPATEPAKAPEPVKAPTPSREPVPV